MNKERGDVEFKAGEKTYILKPTPDCFCQIEADLGRGLLVLAAEFAATRYGFTELLAIVHAGANAGSDENPYDKQEIGDAILDVGTTDTATVVLEFLTTALGGRSKKKPRAKKAAK